MAKQKLSDDDLLAITGQYIQDANSYLDEKIAGERAKALDYYNGANPYNLPLVAGRSKIGIDRCARCD